MRKQMLAAVILFFALTTEVFAAGFEIGANVRAIENDGTEVVGVLTAYQNADQISCLSKSGSYFKLQLKDIKRIKPVTGESYMTGGGTKLPVLKFEMVNGEEILGGISSHGIVKIDLGYKGKQNLWLTDARKYKMVEVVAAGAAGSDKQMKVKLLNGSIINVPVRKEEIQSIIFE